MCLEIKIKKKSIYNILFGLKRKIAKEDIVCYKIYDRIDENTVESTVRHETYKIGELPKVKITSTNRRYKNNVLYDIECGYHSYIQKPKKSSFKNRVTYKCIIPRGSKYLMGGINNWKVLNGYVSDKLIILEEVEYEK